MEGLDGVRRAFICVGIFCRRRDLVGWMTSNQCWIMNKTAIAHGGGGKKWRESLFLACFVTQVLGKRNTVPTRARLILCSMSKGNEWWRGWRMKAGKRVQWSQRIVCLLLAGGGGERKCALCT